MNHQPTIDSVARSQAGSHDGFTLIELLTSMAILGLIIFVLFSIFDQVNKAWILGENRVETFTQARAVLDIMSRELSQAVATTNIPFYGDTHVVYFVAPVSSNPQNLADLCELGYEFEAHDSSTPDPWTLRIMRRLIEPSLNNYNSAWNPYATSPLWWDAFLSHRVPQSFESSEVLATNCIMNLQFQYLAADGTALVTPYQSQNNGNKLPYSIVIGLDVVDSRTATRIRQFTPANLSNSVYSATVRNFSNIVYLPNITP